MAISPGMNVAGYEIREVIGEGPTGAAARVRDLTGGHLVLKLIPQARAKKPQVDRMWADVERAKDLGGKQLAEIFDHGWTDGGDFYYVSEEISGVDLGSVLATGTRPGIGEAVQLGVEACEAVAALHRRGVVHGSLKPRNVLVLPKVGGDGVTVRLVDLGTWRLAPDPRDTHAGSWTSSSLDQANYQAPEQFAGDSNRASDVYALGVILYELLSGDLPFTGETPAQLMLRHQQQRPAAPRGVPEALAGIVLRCLDKKPAERYQDAAALGQALREWAAQAKPERGAVLVLPTRGETTTEPVPKMESETGPSIRNLLRENVPTNDNTERRSMDDIVKEHDRTSVASRDQVPPTPAGTASTAEAAAARSPVTAETKGNAVQTDSHASRPATPPVPPVNGTSRPSQPLRIEASRAEDKNREKSVEDAVDAFVLKATASFSSDMDGWDVASDIEQAKQRPRISQQQAVVAPPVPTATAMPAPAPAALEALPAMSMARPSVPTASMAAAPLTANLGPAAARSPFPQEGTALVTPLPAPSRDFSSMEMTVPTSSTWKMYVGMVVCAALGAAIVAFLMRPNPPAPAAPAAPAPTAVQATTTKPAATPTVPMAPAPVAAHPAVPAAAAPVPAAAAPVVATPAPVAAAPTPIHKPVASAQDSAPVRPKHHVVEDDTPPRPKRHAVAEDAAPPVHHTAAPAAKAPKPAKAEKSDWVDPFAQ